jgi:hypothetical protein
MTKKFFVRMIDEWCGGRDRIFLKPMTISEYITYVNKIICKLKKECDELIDRSVYMSDTSEETVEEFVIRWVKRTMTFEFYPIPCDGYQAKNCWINTKNLEKYHK